MQLTGLLAKGRFSLQESVLVRAYGHPALAEEIDETSSANQPVKPNILG